MKSTDRSRLSKTPGDKADQIIANHKVKLTKESLAALENKSGSKKQPSQSKIKAAKMGLDEYLRRFTSEDNASFQEIHEKDREKFLQRIGWMFTESEKYQKLNQLAIEHSD